MRIIFTLLGLALCNAPRQATWATRICRTGDAVVFEGPCACGQPLACRLENMEPGVVAFSLGFDPDHIGVCTDCVAMQPARCSLPAGFTTGRILINDEQALELPADGDCRTSQLAR